MAAMSATFLKLIPTDSNFTPTEVAQRQAIQYVESILPNSGPCEAEVFDHLEFIDQGEYLEKIFCPACGGALETYPGESINEWWHDISDAAEVAGYEAFVVQMPCCQRSVLFRDLTFDLPAGFARFELSVEDPQASDPLPPEQIERLSAILGCPVRQIWARY